MTNADGNNSQNLLLQWIISLAVSVTCCAMLFVFFARSTVEMQTRLGVAEVQIQSLQNKIERYVAKYGALEHVYVPPVAPMPYRPGGAVPSNELPSNAGSVSGAPGMPFPPAGGNEGGMQGGPQQNGVQMQNAPPPSVMPMMPPTMPLPGTVGEPPQAPVAPAAPIVPDAPAEKGEALTPTVKE